MGKSPGGLTGGEIHSSGHSSHKRQSSRNTKGEEQQNGGYLRARRVLCLSHTSLGHQIRGAKTFSNHICKHLRELLEIFKKMHGCIYFYCIFQLDKMYNSSGFSHVCCLQISISTISLFSTDHPQYIRYL